MATTIQNPPPKNPDNDSEDGELSGRQMSFLEHLEELRQRLVRAVLSIIVAFGICFAFHEKIYAYLAKPLTDTLRALHMPDKLVYTNPIDPFNLYMKISRHGRPFSGLSVRPLAVMVVYFSGSLPE